MTTPQLSDVTVVVPVRNAEAFIEESLTAIVDAGPAEIIVVDGLSTDRTLELAARYPVRTLSDEGRGVAAARVLGAEAATTRWVALVDVDVILPPGALQALLEETVEGGYTALQARLASTSGPGYWGRALVNHHMSGRSQHWFGLVATIFERQAFLEQGLDAAFLSGEDIELRWRLERSGARIGVSTRTVVLHRFGDDFEFARGQFLADGAGLARMATKHGWRAAALLGLPLAAAIRGSLLSVFRGQPSWIPYYAAFFFGNSIGMVRALSAQLRDRKA